MDCKRCDLYTVDQVLEKNGGLCTMCYEKVCFCIKCRRNISFDNSVKNKNYCIDCFETYSNIQYKKDQIYSTVSILNKILISALLISVSIIILFFIGGPTVDFQGIKFSIDRSWIIFLILTICHLFVRTMLIKQVKDIISFEDNNINRELFNKIRSSDNIFFNGFFPIESYMAKLPAFYSLFIGFKPNMNFALFFLTFFLLFFSVFLSSLTSARLISHAFSIANAFTIVNWFIATNWVFALSKLRLSSYDQE